MRSIFTPALIRLNQNFVASPLSSGRAGGFTVAGPSKGPDRNRQSQNQQLHTSHLNGSFVYEEKHTSGTVKLRVPPRQSRGNSHFIRIGFVDGRKGWLPISCRFRSRLGGPLAR